ncbi:MAG: hypothetical protein HC795_09240 [Coleofasciculaceae cyanobacterium RL_1_1]|nr:hypothetical protein [Coleofasciculaceae cyanobacterium RL_1_1]
MAAPNLLAKAGRYLLDLDLDFDDLAEFSDERFEDLEDLEESAIVV